MSDRFRHRVSAYPVAVALMVVATGCGELVADGQTDPADVAVSQAAVTATPSDLDPDKVLMVRDVSVVDKDTTSDPIRDPVRTLDPCKSRNLADANRHWTFGYLLTQMAANSGLTPSAFAVDWLNKWANTSQVWATPAPKSVPFNPSTTLAEQVAPETGEGTSKTVAGVLLARWRQASCLQSKGRDGEDPAADTICPPWIANATALAMNKAPFRLTAIVNRLDLRTPGYFGEGNAGELRFVFMIVDPMVREGDPNNGSCAAMSAAPTISPATNDVGKQFIILEYAANKADPRAYARQWENLNLLPINSTGYRAQLQTITDSIVNSGAAPANANRSALIRIRTNITGNDESWFLREFMISTRGTLVPVEVKQTPQARFDNTSTLSDWANANQQAILNGTHLLPSRIVVSGQLQLFRDVKAQNFFGTTFWTAAVPSDVRHKLSLNTCNGCHGRETDNATGGNGFSHVSGRLYGQAAGISSFLSGLDELGRPYRVGDPITGEVRVLGEFQRRQTDMWNMIYQ